MKSQATVSKSVLFLTQGGIIAALYIILVLLFAPISFMSVQFRIAEALTILPYFSPAAIPGLTIGCLLGNFIGGADMLDVMFGTLATFLGAIGSYALRRNKFLVPLPPIIFNTIIIPYVLQTAYGLEDAYPVLMLTVGIGEIVSCGFFGLLFLFALYPHRFKIFRK